MIKLTMIAGRNSIENRADIILYKIIEKRVIAMFSEGFNVGILDLTDGGMFKDLSKYTIDREN